MGKALIIKGADFSTNRMATEKFYKIELSISPEGSGTVTGSGTYISGTQISISATPNSGYDFVKWSDNNVNASRTITVTKDLSLTATFIDNTMSSITLDGTENWEANPASAPNPNPYGYYNVYLETTISPKIASDDIGFAQATCSDSYFNRLGEGEMQITQSPCFNYYKGTRTIFFRFPSSKMTQSVDAWKAYLAANPITITYLKA